MDLITRALGHLRHIPKQNLVTQCVFIETHRVPSLVGEGSEHIRIPVFMELTF